MQMLVPRFLEASIESLTREQEKFRQQMTQAFGTGPFGAGAFGPLEEQVRRNMEMFERAFAMFTPFGKRETKPPEEEKPPRTGEGESEIDALKRQMEEMQKRLDRMGEKKE
jgi:polyhydroxyalkanoate synthesis regulator protein